MHVKIISSISECNNVYELNNTGWSSKLPPLQPSLPRHLPIIPGQNLIINRAICTKATERQIIANSIKVFTVASLQQYTNSFSQENYVGEGTLGPVYKGELPDGKVLFFYFSVFSHYFMFITSLTWPWFLWKEREGRVKFSIWINIFLIENERNKTRY